MRTLALLLALGACGGGGKDVLTEESIAGDWVLVEASAACATVRLHSLSLSSSRGRAAAWSQACGNGLNMDMTIVEHTVELAPFELLDATYDLLLVEDGAELLLEGTVAFQGETCAITGRLRRQPGCLFSDD